MLEQLEQLSCWIAAKTLKNGKDLLKGHLVFSLLCGTFSQDPVSFPNLINTSMKRALACNYKDISFDTDCCLALGKLSYPSGFHLLVYRMRTSQQTILEAPCSFNIPGFHDPKPWSLLSEQFPDQLHVLSILFGHSQMVSILRALGCWL